MNVICWNYLAKLILLSNYALRRISRLILMLMEKSTCDNSNIIIGTIKYFYILMIWVNMNAWDIAWRRYSGLIETFSKQFLREDFFHYVVCALSWLIIGSKKSESLIYCVLCIVNVSTVETFRDLLIFL